MEQPTTDRGRHRDAKVIDLARPTATTSVRVERSDNPLGHLSEQDRMRLIIRVLCELVALDDVGELAPPHAAAS